MKKKICCIKDLPENTPDQVQEKVRCYLDENRQLELYLAIVKQKISNNNDDLLDLIGREAKKTRNKYGLKSVEFLT